MEFEIRQATTDDVAVITDIYNQWIIDSHVSFDEKPWTLGERLTWFETYAATGPYRCLVATDANSHVVGMSYSSPFRPKAAYRRSVETTVVVSKQVLGFGIGRHLLIALLGALSAEPVHRAYAMIALPNDASVSLHQQLGYRSVGTLDEVGFKYGKTWSTQLLELRLDEPKEQ